MTKNQLTSRKWILGITIFVIATTIFIFSSKLTGDNWVDLVKWIFGEFVLGNIIAKFANRGK